MRFSSYHIRIESEDVNRNMTAALSRLKGVNAVLPFMELQTLCRGRGTDYTPCLLRGVPGDCGELDPGLIEQLNIQRGEFDLRGTGGIVIGFESAYRLGVDVGDTVSVVSMAGESFSLLSPEIEEFTVTGIYRSGYYEFDSNPFIYFD